ncbi:hypothetical protein [Lelliottia nimipressuralis]|uniref:Lipoprotein n=1 Tax=Lelliottia nimipressuralis TaxID=69220 RepID=A0ABD4KJQ0_9ENTR|nr:hypothetical protein [Lelliottia nimipressuralis]MBF4180804.1 hypothetical protein [Lelliottia nimipressuralis]
MTKLVIGLGLVVAAGSLSGCATIVCDSTHSAQVTSSPIDAASDPEMQS